MLILMYDRVRPAPLQRAEVESAEGGGPTVTEQDIANIVAQWTGIPIEKVCVSLAWTAKLLLQNNNKLLASFSVRSTPRQCQSRPAIHLSCTPLLQPVLLHATPCRCPPMRLSGW